MRQLKVFNVDYHDVCSDILWFRRPTNLWWSSVDSDRDGQSYRECEMTLFYVVCDLMILFSIIEQQGLTLVSADCFGMSL